MQQSDHQASARLYYIHDPMCSWCWAFQPCWEQVQRALPEDLAIVRLLGGLAPDSDESMAVEMQRFLQQTWQRIQQQVPGTEFNFDFWQQCLPRRSTYPACRAIIAARLQRPDAETSMIRAIQRGYYLQARNPSDASMLIELAAEIGLDTKQFAEDLQDPATGRDLQQQIDQGQQLGAQGFPSLVLVQQGKVSRVALDYNEPLNIIGQINRLLGC